MWNTVDENLNTSQHHCCTFLAVFKRVSACRKQLTCLTSILFFSSPCSSLFCISLSYWARRACMLTSSLSLASSVAWSSSSSSSIWVLCSSTWLSKARFAFSSSWTWGIQQRLRRSENFQSRIPLKPSNVHFYASKHTIPTLIPREPIIDVKKWPWAPIRTWFAVLLLLWSQQLSVVKHFLWNWSYVFADIILGGDDIFQFAGLLQAQSVCLLQTIPQVLQVSRQVQDSRFLLSAFALNTVALHSQPARFSSQFTQELFFHSLTAREPMVFQQKQNLWLATFHANDLVLV